MQSGVFFDKLSLAGSMITAVLRALAVLTKERGNRPGQRRLRSIAMKDSERFHPENKTNSRDGR